MKRARQDRLILKLLNRALDAADEEQILLLFSRMIAHLNKSNFAAQSGLNRVTLYQTLSGVFTGEFPKIGNRLESIECLRSAIQMLSKDHREIFPHRAAKNDGRAVKRRLRDGRSRSDLTRVR